MNSQTSNDIHTGQDHPSAIQRRHITPLVKVGHVQMGGGTPVVVQSMTNTSTADVEATFHQIVELHEAGSELVRLTVDTLDAARAVPHIVEKLRNKGVFVPVVGDFHYIGHKLLKEVPACAEALDKYRINPGNVGTHEKRDIRFGMMIESAIRYGKVVRIGVNWGSLNQELLARLMDENAQLASPQSPTQVMHSAIVESALQSAERAVEIGLDPSRIIVSAKVSAVQDMLSVYRALAKDGRFALHLGLTEAGMGRRGTVASTAGLAILLAEGIGDTIRVSLTPRPGEDRCEEVLVAKDILQTLGLRQFTPQVTACPGCGRTTSTVFQTLAMQVDEDIRVNMRQWKLKYPGVEKLKIAVMGCIVNGPGESRHADIGISLPGTGEQPAAPVYVDGSHVATLRGNDLSGQFMAMINDYVEKRFGI